MRGSVRRLLALVFCGMFLPRTAFGLDTRYVISRGAVAEELLRIVLDENPDIEAFGIEPEKLKEDPVVQGYAWDILQKSAISEKQFTSDITVGAIYTLSGQLKHDICANVKSPNYMDKHVVHREGLTGWLKNTKNCVEAFGDAALAANKHVVVRMIRGTREGVQFKPDSFGYTFYSSDDRKHEFRRMAEASEKLLSVSPSGSIRAAIFYGHGSPGAMSIEKGNEGYLDGGKVIAALADKMAVGGEVHLVGCNTSSVPMFVAFDAALPAKGYSYLFRGLVYYGGARAAGASHENSKELWNLDMALEVSRGLRGVKVCGLRTFGLVPARLVGSVRVEPGLVLGERACFLDGRCAHL